MSMNELLLNEIKQKIELGTPTYYIRTPKEYMMKELPVTLDELAIEIILDMLNDGTSDISKYLKEYDENIKWLNERIPYLQTVMAEYLKIEINEPDQEVCRIAKWEYNYLNEMIEYYILLSDLINILKVKNQDYFSEIIKEIHKNPKEYQKRTDISDNFKKVTKKLLKNVK